MPQTVSCQAIREKFTRFFEEQGHTAVPSASLIPGNDPTLLFTNAGMVPFKDVFLGHEQRDYSRATSIQRCVRAGGKHNDLENVGFTARHHTFFEMLGNFSFGDYFKREAIRFAWDFLTDVLGIPEEKLWVTVFEKDDETADIWLKEMKVSEARFSRCGEKDNFWQMGDTGPCGPCTEIFYDHGDAIQGGPPGSPDEDGDRYIEIWNLVFMQYNRDVAGKLTPLPKPSVDTGMGLERIAAVMQGVHSNYEIDIFRDLIRAAQEITLAKDAKAQSLKVIADHIRSTAFLILDGVRPSNEGRGYVLRRIIRRAVRHGHKLGATKPFFHALVPALAKTMGKAYPELSQQRLMIEQILLQEEEQFAQTLDKGLGVLEDGIAALKGDTLSGELVFKLYDTFGFPLDLTADIAREKNLKIDEKGFDQCMVEQRERSRDASTFKAHQVSFDTQEKTVFLGYGQHAADATVLQLFSAEGKASKQFIAGDECVIVLNQTPFYAESGGQVGDTGILRHQQGLTIKVHDTQKQADTFLHYAYIKSGELKVGDQLTAEVDGEKRQATRLNHSATHLLHAALREILGDHVVQKGSLVGPDRLRFDFSHFEGLCQSTLFEIETLVNQAIRQNDAVETVETDPDTAKNMGAMALFGEKYGSKVRVLKMGEFSIELCGGTHVTRTGDIGLFKILQESGIAAGVRRIEAATGYQALKHVQDEEANLFNIASQLKAKPEVLHLKIDELKAALKQHEKSLTHLQAKLAAGQAADLMNQAEKVGDMAILSVKVTVPDNQALRQMADSFKAKLENAVIVLGAEITGKAALIACVNGSAKNTLKAGDLIKHIAPFVDGRGGGRPDMAQAGGNAPEKLDTALSEVLAWVKTQVK